LKNSKPIRQVALREIDRFVWLLGKKNIEKTFGAIDNVVHNFKVKPPSEYNHKCFHQTILLFVKKIYEEGLGDRKIISGERLHDVAISLLDQACSDGEFNGYDLSVAVAQINPAQEMRNILLQVANYIKLERKKQYISWVENVYFRPLPWNVKREITQVLFEKRNAEACPEENTNSLERWTHDAFSLLRTYVDFIDYLQR